MNVRILYTVLITLSLSTLSLPVNSADESTTSETAENTGGGKDAKLKSMCKLLTKGTKYVVKAKNFARNKAELEKLKLLAASVHKAQLESKVSLNDVAPEDLVAVYSVWRSQKAVVRSLQEQQTAKQKQEEEDGWSSVDIARTASSVAAIANPTGAIGVVATYTYPQCGTEEARKGNGGFCWKNSTAAAWAS